MSLPNPGMDAVPFTPLTAEFLDDMIENIESLADGTGFDAGAIGTTDIANSAVTFAKTSGIWWEELGRTTLGTAGDTITVNVSTRSYMRLLVRLVPTGGTIGAYLRFNGDTGNNYGYIRLQSTGAAVTAASGAPNAYIQIAAGDLATVRAYTIDVFNNSASTEKTVYATETDNGALGASSLPQLRIVNGKWANTSSQITSITVYNASGTGDYAIGSEVVVLGHN